MCVFDVVSRLFFFLLFLFQAAVTNNKKNRHQNKMNKIDEEEGTKRIIHLMGHISTWN